MNILTTNFLNRLKLPFKESDQAFNLNGGDPPMRSELFNAVQMEQNGRWLATAHAEGSMTLSDKPLLWRAWTAIKMMNYEFQTSDHQAISPCLQTPFQAMSFWSLPLICLLL